MTAIVVPNYPLDLTSSDPRNRITNERHTFVTDTDRIFVPSAGPFYVSSFVIRNATTGVILKPTIDYKLLHPDIDAIHESGLHVCCAVFVVNDAISSVTIDYQVIGGQYSDLIPVVRELLANIDTIQPTINWYTQVYAKPDSYPPAPHWHTGNDFSEWDRIALRLDEIMSALVYKDRYSWQSAYDYVDRIVKLASDSLRADLDMTQQFNNVYSKSQATELFLSKVDAAAAYLSKVDATATYLSKVDATATYLSKADASSTYLTKTNVSSTYATRDDLTGVNNSLAALINNVATDLNQNYIKKTDGNTVNSLISATNSTIINMINARTKVSPDSGNALVVRANGLYVPTPPEPPALPDLSVYALASDVQTLRDEVNRLSGLVTTMKKVTDGLLAGSFIINTTYQDNTSKGTITLMREGTIELTSILITDIVSLQASPTISNYTKSREASLNTNGRDDVFKDYITSVDVVIPDIVTSIDQIVLYWSSEEIKRRWGGDDYVIMSELPTMSFNSSNSTLTITGKWSIDLRIGIKAATT